MIHQYHMKKILLMLGFFLPDILLLAQDSIQRSLLWEIRRNDLGRPSYLFGTVHMIPKDDFFIPDGMDHCLDSSETVYLELDMNEMSDMGKMMSIMDKCYMKEGKTLQDLMNAEDYALVKTKLEAMGLPAMFFDRMKPLFITSLAGMDDGSQGGIQADDIRSYELELTERAKVKKKPLKGIESIEFQLSIFDSIPYDVQARSLVDAMKNEKAGDQMMKELIALYKKSDINGLAETAEQSDEALKPYMDLMLKSRNKSWSPRMTEAMKTGSCFFAFGVGHLGGPDGLISLLRKESFVVTPVIK